jgi:hypothetical protein
MDSFVPKEPAILKDEMHLNEFAFAVMLHPWHTRM